MTASASSYAARAGLKVSKPILEFAEETLAEQALDADRFWHGLSSIFRDLTPRNRDLLAQRDRIQADIDEYHRANPGPPSPSEYHEFLTRIGYIVDQPGTVFITTQGVDEEIALLAGPQLVVPLLNARFAINAANARWGSLYDALYGTDAIPEDGAHARGTSYNPVRGAAVIARGRQLLDDIAPLARGSHAEATRYLVRDGHLTVATSSGETGLRDAAAFAGFTGDAAAPSSVLLRHHGLHVDVLIAPDGTIGATDAAHIDDILVESAVTTIMDLEDSVAAVDADDKALGYRNWLGLMRQTLSAKVARDGSTFTRVLRSDRVYTAPDGTALTLPGRSLLLIRTVGHLMTTDAVLDSAGNPVYEGILDTVMTALGALPDLRGQNAGANSRTGSVYIVKPKMHGPAEVAFAVEIFRRVEELIGLAPRTLKIGIMDEERRTSVNLRACIAAAADRVVFINTGFLDRTGDEIHTSLHAGAVVPKAQLKHQTFLAAYEDLNVAAGIEAGFVGRAQIGKGMWAMPDLMHDMMEQKIEHLRSGASTAWVPSPTAATLHALHYHAVDVRAVQADIAGIRGSSTDELLVPPLMIESLTGDEIRTELDNNVQSILGYVVRWIDQGIGCSKVPDIHGVALMEDRATLRISSQLVANWLTHGLIDLADVDDSLRRLSPVVDAQNADDPDYEKLADDDYSGIAFRAARRLIVEGAAQPNGYTDVILHDMRREKKAAQRSARTAE